MRANVHHLRDLLKLLYKDSPPKLDSHVLGSLEPDKLKRTLLEATMHYHTDKQMRHKDLPPAAWGVGCALNHWYVLCEGISSRLNSLYMYTYPKGVETVSETETETATETTENAQEEQQEEENSEQDDSE